MTINIYRATVALFCFVFIIILTSYVREEFNPDWFGYMRIFEDGGWLNDEGRDPGFLTIISLFKTTFGSNYILFRLTLAIYFSVFLFFLARGSLLPYSKNHSTFLAVLSVLICFSLVRFSIQIREGLAVTFIIFGLRQLSKSYHSQETEQAETLKQKSLAFLFFCISASIHGGTLPIALIYACSIALSFLRNTSSEAYNIVLFYFKYITLLLAFIFPFVYSYIVSENSFFVNRFDTTESVQISGGKLGYWFLYGLLIFALRAKLIKYIRPLREDTYKILIALIGDLFLKVLYIIIVVFIILQFPSSLVAAAIRLLNVILSLIILLLVYNTKNSILISLSAFFIMIDQVRTVIEALLTLNFV